jgi:hypothetical protein
MKGAGFVKCVGVCASGAFPLVRLLSRFDGIFDQEKPYMKCLSDPLECVFDYR